MSRREHQPKKEHLRSLLLIDFQDFRRARGLPLMSEGKTVGILIVSETTLFEAIWIGPEEIVPLDDATVVAISDWLEAIKKRRDVIILHA